MKQSYIHRPGVTTEVLPNASAIVARLDPANAWLIEISRFVEPRSLRANRFMWAAKYAPLVARIGYTPADWHEFMCGDYFGWKTVDKPGGRTETVPKRTTTTNELGERDVLKGAAFSDFLAWVDSRIAERLAG